MVTLEKSDPYSQKGPPLPSYIIFRLQNTTSFPGVRVISHFTRGKQVQGSYKMTCPKSPERGAELRCQPKSIRCLWDPTACSGSRQTADPPARTYFFSSLLPASCPSGHLELSLNEHNLNTNIFWMIE